MMGVATVMSWISVALFGVGSGCWHSVLVGVGSVVVGRCRSLQCCPRCVCVCLYMCVSWVSVLLR